MPQEMQFGEQANQDGPKFSSGYEGIPNYQSAPSFDSSSTALHGQKLTESAWSRPSAAQRLALAIVSLLAFVAIFAITLFIGMNVFTLSRGADFVQWLIIIGLIFYLIIAVVVNILFHRRAR